VYRPSVVAGLDTAWSEAVGDSVVMIVYGIFVVKNIICRVARVLAMVGHGLGASSVWWAVVGTRSGGRSSGPAPGARKTVRAAKRARLVGSAIQMGGVMIVEENVTEFE
jgi:hypothetical protein